ncbi:type III pantothenate kinase [Pseudoduganella plicata]|uniref:Type III pantothenate kinase n=1 Tax=Pseudoduganella plicata TaxID=321984 RepID=A0A4P7BHD1_9BURK|nr:type III pantothenate kinase [Pseudoduganella plicata]QBQ38221.1 type III pantothenate kinase [Pseudoduganella plicata]GGY80328.1 type III pantothenate kinase [Pseudoduganella plicata]
MTTWLLVDAGNTRVKWAVTASTGSWLAQGAVAHADAAGLEAQWLAAFASAMPTRVLAANVAGAAVRARLEAALDIAAPAAQVEWFASSAERAGLVNGYRNPAQLGCDRFAAAIGARALAPGRPLIVANCGTATTIDAVGADGTFIGGMILPGLGLMASSLARNTAQLPQIAPGATLRSPFADNTDDAILAGCLSAQTGAIERAFARHGAVECVISGGAAQYIVPTLGPDLGRTLRHVDNLVMIGLQAVVRAEENAC